METFTKKGYHLELKVEGFFKNSKFHSLISPLIMMLECKMYVVCKKVVCFMYNKKLQNFYTQIQTNIYNNNSIDN